MAIAFLGCNRRLQTGYFAQQMGAGTNTIKLILWYRITKLMMGNKFFLVEFLNPNF